MGQLRDGHGQEFEVDEDRVNEEEDYDDFEANEGYRYFGNDLYEDDSESEGNQHMMEFDQLAKKMSPMEV